MPEFPLKKLSNALRRKSNEEAAGIPDKELARARENLSMLNGQMDEVLEHFLTKKLEKRIHEVDTFDQIPDDMEYDIARWSIKLSLYVLRDVITDLIQRDLKRQAAMDEKQQTMIDKLMSAIKYLGWSMLIGGLTVLGWLFRTVIFKMISGELPLPLP